MLVTSNPMTTIALSIAALFIGLPLAVITILFEQARTPQVALDSSSLLLSGPNNAICAAAYLSIVASVLVAVFLVVVRHFKNHFVFGWAVFGPALADLLATIGCLAYVYAMHGRYSEAYTKEEVGYVDGRYAAGGKSYTKEAWACSMNNIYPEREGEWANQACSQFRTGRLMMVPLIVCATFLLALAYWQVHQLGGFGYLFGKRNRIGAVAQPDGRYIDLEK